MAETSLGNAIGISQKPNLYANLAAQTLARQDAKEAAKAAAIAKKQDNADKELRAISEKDFKIDPKLYHNSFIPDVQELVVGGIDKIHKAMKENPNGYSNVIAPIIAEIQGGLAVYQNQSKQAFGMEKDIHDNKIVASPDFIEAFNKPENFGKIGRTHLKSEPAYGMTVDEQGFFNYNPVLQSNLPKVIHSFNYFTVDPKLTTTKRVVGGMPNQWETNTYTVPNENSLNGVIDQAVNDPNEIRNYVARHKEIQDDFDKGKFTVDQVKQGIKDEIIKGVGGAKVSSTRRAPSVPQERASTPFVSAEAGNGRFKWDHSSNTSERGVTGDELRKVVEKFPTDFKSLKTGKAMEEIKTAFDNKEYDKAKKLYYDYFKISPAYDIVGSWSIKDIDKGENAPQNFNVKDEKTGRSITITGSLVSVDKLKNKKTGEIKKEGVFISDGIVSRYPYDQVKDAIEGYTVDKKGTQGSGFNLDRIESSSQIPTINSQDDFDKLPSGSKFIDGNGVTHTKK